MLRTELDSAADEHVAHMASCRRRRSSTDCSADWHSIMPYQVRSAAGVAGGRSITDRCAVGRIVLAKANGEVRSEP